MELALKFKKFIENKYNGTLGSYKFIINLNNIDSVSQMQDASAYYFFNLIEPKKKKILLDAKKSNRICFGYDSKDFSNDILIGLLLKEKTYIYLNKSSLHVIIIIFIPIFYKITKVI